MHLKKNMPKISGKNVAYANNTHALVGWLVEFFGTVWLVGWLYGA
jgi:hypothetical protein